MITEAAVCVLVVVVVVAAAVPICGCGKRKKQANKASALDPHGGQTTGVLVLDAKVAKTAMVEAPAVDPLQEGGESLTTVDETGKSLALQTVVGPIESSSPRMAAARKILELGDAKSLEMQSIGFRKVEEQTNGGTRDSASTDDRYGTFMMTNFDRYTNFKDWDRDDTLKNTNFDGDAGTNPLWPPETPPIVAYSASEKGKSIIGVWMQRNEVQFPDLTRRDSTQELEPSLRSTTVIIDRSVRPE